ncbi:MAG: hypothetical protein AB1327_07735 [Bacillota bacterium]|uniref:hypothetical protein n=1 Tax=Desulforudis sp. DRI-14 TaxID=3459793 RepID=UPI00347D523B
MRLLGARLADHAAFLERELAVRSPATPIAPSDAGTSAKAAYGHLPAFRQLDMPHKALHNMAADLVRQAKAETAAELAETSLELLKGFISLKKAIAELAASRARNGGRA